MAAQEEIVALEVCEQNHRAGWSEQSSECTLLSMKLYNALPESEEMMKAQMQTALDKSSAAKIDLQLQLKERR